MIRAVIADCESQLKAAYRLRYDVFCTESGDNRYADHVQRVHRDRDDGPQSLTIVALNDEDAVIGTIRVTLLREWKFIGIEVYELEKLASVVGATINELESRLARIDRVVIAPKYRGTRAIIELQRACEDLALANRCDLLVGVPGVDNLLARKTFTRLGYSEYGGANSFNGVTCQLIYKQINENLFAPSLPRKEVSDE